MARTAVLAVLVGVAALSLLPAPGDRAMRDAEASHTPSDIMSIRHSGGDPGPYGGGSVLIVPVGGTFDVEIWIDASSAPYHGYFWEIAYDPSTVVHVPGMTYELNASFGLCDPASTETYGSFVIYGQGAGCISAGAPVQFVGQTTQIRMECIAPAQSLSSPTPVLLVAQANNEDQFTDAVFGTLIADPGGPIRPVSTRYKGVSPFGGMSAQISVVCANAADYPAEDFDGDGCSNSEELGTNQLTGGKRDPYNRYDFFDVPTPALSAGMPNGAKNQAISLVDVGGPLAYVGTTDGGMPNPAGYAYDSDYNTNAIDDGAEYDRTPSIVMGEPWHSRAPNGAVSLQDVGVALAQVGTNCSAAP
jgi:hypothetical protein